MPHVWRQAIRCSAHHQGERPAGGTFNGRTGVPPTGDGSHQVRLRRGGGGPLQVAERPVPPGWEINCGTSAVAVAHAAVPDGGFFDYRARGRHPMQSTPRSDCGLPALQAAFECPRLRSDVGHPQGSAMPGGTLPSRGRIGAGNSLVWRSRQLPATGGSRQNHPANRMRPGRDLHPGTGTCGLGAGPRVLVRSAVECSWLHAVARRSENRFLQTSVVVAAADARTPTRQTVRRWSLFRRCRHEERLPGSRDREMDHPRGCEGGPCRLPLAH